MCCCVSSAGKSGKKMGYGRYRCTGVDCVGGSGSKGEAVLLPQQPTATPTLSEFTFPLSCERTIPQLLGIMMRGRLARLKFRYVHIELNVVCGFCITRPTNGPVQLLVGSFLFSLHFLFGSLVKVSFHPNRSTNKLNSGALPF